jgi:hypothetical protein
MPISLILCMIINKLGYAVILSYKFHMGITKNDFIIDHKKGELVLALLYISSIPYQPKITPSSNKLCP